MIDPTVDVWIGGLVVGAVGAAIVAALNIIQTRILGKQAIALAHETSRLATERQKANWAREDKIAARLDLVRDEVAATSRANVIRTKEVARLTAETSAAQISQLKQIHTLVNSEKTDTMQAELSQTRITLALLRRFVVLDDKSGRVSTPADVAAIKLAEASILRLETALKARGIQLQAVETEIKESKEAKEAKEAKEDASVWPEPSADGRVAGFSQLKNIDEPSA